VLPAGTAPWYIKAYSPGSKPFGVTLNLLPSMVSISKLIAYLGSIPSFSLTMLLLPVITSLRFRFSLTSSFARTNSLGELAVRNHQSNAPLELPWPVCRLSTSVVDGSNINVNSGFLSLKTLFDLDPDNLAFFVDGIKPETNLLAALSLLVPEKTVG